MNLVPLLSGILSMSVIGSGGISDILVHISNQPTLMRLGILGQMVTSSGIIVLSVLLYVVLRLRAVKPSTFACRKMDRNQLCPTI